MQPLGTGGDPIEYAAYDLKVAALGLRYDEALTLAIEQLHAQQPRRP